MMSTLIKNVPGKLVFVLVTLLVSACGVPEGLTVRNLANATVTPVQRQVAASGTTEASNVAPAAATTPAPTGAAAATTAPTQDPMANMPGMESTQPAQPTAAGNATSAGPQAAATDYVAIWLIWGTPTPTLARSGGGTTSGSTAAATSAPATPAAPAATQVVTTAPTATLGPTTVPATAGAGDPANGKTIFSSLAPCSTCHDVSQGIVMVGPSLKGVASRAGSRKPGMSAEDYLRESILTPNAFVVPNFAPGLMPQNFAQMLTPQQINDLIAYLMTLK